MKKGNDFMSKITLPKDRIFITPSLLRVRYGGDFDPNVFKRWQDTGEIVKIRNGLYARTDFEMRGDLDRFLVAKNLYEPSYVSLHSALKYYNIIPESVYTVTSLTTRKTQEFSFNHTTYSFQKLKQKLFFGFSPVEWRGETFLMASPEKALLDLAYFEPRFSDPDWLEEMRFDPMELRDLLRWEYMFLHAMVFDSRTVYLRITALLNFLDQ